VFWIDAPPSSSRTVAPDWTTPPLPSWLVSATPHLDDAFFEPLFDYAAEDRYLRAHN